MNFLHQLQALPDPAKKKVLIGTTAALMIIVVYFWLAYFNNLLAGISQPVAVDSDAQQLSGTASSESAGESISTQVGNLFSGIANIFRSPQQYIVKPSN